MIYLQNTNEFKNLKYDSETGKFIWLVDPTSKVKAGSVAGSFNNGYIEIGCSGKRFYAHRLAWFFVKGVWPSGVIDHINGNRLDNRIENLRDVTHAVNIQNVKKPNKDGTSGFLGVSFHKPRRKWVARIKIAGKYAYLGLYETAELAHDAYLAAKRRHHAGCTI